MDVSISELELTPGDLAGCLAHLMERAFSMSLDLSKSMARMPAVASRLRVALGDGPVMPMLPCLALVLAGGWSGGAWGLLLSAAGAFGLWWLKGPRPSGPRKPDGGEDLGPPASGERGDATALLGEVVSAWNKQAVFSREYNREGLEKLLLTFSTLSDLMTSMSRQLQNFQVAAAPGSIGDAVQAGSGALDELMAPMQRAFAQRDAMLEQVRACTTTMSTLLQWSKEARDLAQHTRMVAFNASIESARGFQGSPEEQAARQTISNEIRRVSESIVNLCDGLDDLIRPLNERASTVQQEGVINDTNDEQLRVELEWRARRALEAMFTSMGGSLSGGTNLLEASQNISQHMEEAFTQFQFGDRVEQMLQIICADMERMIDWSREPTAMTAQDVERWLKRLEDNYTMDEQRSQHHNTEMVDRSGRVEFF